MTELVWGMTKEVIEAQCPNAGGWSRSILNSDKNVKQRDEWKVPLTCRRRQKPRKADPGRKILRLAIFGAHRSFLSFGFTDLARNKPACVVTTRR